MSEFIRVGAIEEKKIRSIDFDKSVGILLNSLRLRGELHARRAVMECLQKPAVIADQGAKGISLEAEADLRMAAAMIHAADLVETELKEDHFIAKL